MNATVTTYENREAWLASRSMHLGASEIAAAIGQSPFKSQFALWSEKITGEREQVDSEAAWWGTKLEPFVIDAYREKSGRQVDAWNQNNVVSHNDYPWLRCTPDAVQRDWDVGPGTLQIKTTSAYLAKNWRDEPPLHIQIQAQFEAWILGYDYGTVCCLIGGQKLEWHDFKVNQRFINSALKKLEWFWHLVESKEPPEVDGSESTANAIARVWPEDNGDTIQLDSSIDKLISQRAKFKQRADKAQSAIDEIDNRLKAAMGANQIGITESGCKVTYKTQHRKAYTKVVEATSFRMLRVSQKGN